MGIEIERKFLVLSKAFMDDALRSYQIKQGFLNSHKDRTVRIRVLNNKGYLTIKGKSSQDGLSRFEWETELSRSEAEALLNLCEDGIIKKERFEVPIEGHLFEIDVFDGENKGLVIAEIELQSPDEYFKRPQWLGKEVTGDIKYYNSNLSIQPFKTWNH